MGKGFDRLAVGGLTLGAASVALGGVAQAVTVGTPLDLTTGGLTYSSFSRDTCETATSALAVNDISQSFTPSFTDTFGDSGLCFTVNGDHYDQPTGVDALKVTTNATGIKVKGFPDFNGAIKFNVKFQLFSAAPLVRQEMIVKNTGGVGMPVSLQWDNQLHDADPDVAATQSGDTTIGGSDNWIILDQDFASAETDLLVGRGSGWDALITTPGPVEDGYVEDRSFLLGPGEKVRVVVFVRIGSSVPALATVADDFDGPDVAEFYKGNMSATARGQVPNWSFS